LSVVRLRSRAIARLDRPADLGVEPIGVGGDLVCPPFSRRSARWRLVLRFVRRRSLAGRLATLARTT
jgi:hypothetical protein